MTNKEKKMVEKLRKGVFASCSDCPVGCDDEDCTFGIVATMIESLSAELEQVKRERDAAVETLQDSAYCGDCVHHAKSMEEEPCNTCIKYLFCYKPNWQWRGVKEEEK